jgi:hypothetical protein
MHLAVHVRELLPNVNIVNSTSNYLLYNTRCPQCSVANIVRACDIVHATCMLLQTTRQWPSTINVPVHVRELLPTVNIVNSTSNYLLYNPRCTQCSMPSFARACSHYIHAPTYNKTTIIYLTVHVRALLHTVKTVNSTSNYSSIVRA